MIVLAGLFAVFLVPLHGLEGQTIWVSPRKVVSVRTPRDMAENHYAPGVQCVLEMTNGTRVVVVDPCKDVLEALEPGNNP